MRILLRGDSTGRRQGDPSPSPPWIIIRTGHGQCPGVMVGPASRSPGQSPWYGKYQIFSTSKIFPVSVGLLGPASRSRIDHARSCLRPSDSGRPPGLGTRSGRDSGLFLKSARGYQARKVDHRTGSGGAARLGRRDGLRRRGHRARGLRGPAASRGPRLRPPPGSGGNRRAGCRADRWTPSRSIPRSHSFVILMSVGLTTEWHRRLLVIRSLLHPSPVPPDGLAWSLPFSSTRKAACGSPSP
jgi:hypothetical protein